MINVKQLKRYCSEDISKIENYDLAINDNTQVWDCHHRLEIQGKTKRTACELSRCGLYWNRPADELIFLTHSEHIRLHNIDNTYAKGKKTWLGKHHSIETRKKLSISHSGENNPMFGKHHSEETKKKISLSQSGKHLSEETRKKLSIANSGEKCPMFGTHWWNNGFECVRSRECPGEGWVRGRLKLNNHK